MAKQRIIKSILKKREKLDHPKQDIIVTKIILLGLAWFAHILRLFQ